jgi:hypothetical protein
MLTAENGCFSSASSSVKATPSRSESAENRLQVDDVSTLSTNCSQVSEIVTEHALPLQIPTQ